MACQYLQQRSLGSVKNVSESNLIGTRVSNKTDAPPAVTPDRKVKDTSVQLPSRSQPANQRAADNLPHIELISLGKPSAYCNHARAVYQILLFNTG